jgi:hypothetical protein
MLELYITAIKFQSTSSDCNIKETNEDNLLELMLETLSGTGSMPETTAGKSIMLIP